MFEIFAFLLIFTISAAVLTGLIYFSGQTFELDVSQSWVLAVLILAVFLPAIANLIIALNPKSPEDRVEKVFALLRGFGMTILGLTILAKYFLVEMSSILFWGGLVIGAFLWWGLLAFEDNYRSKKN